MLYILYNSLEINKLIEKKKLFKSSFLKYMMTKNFRYQ